MLRSPICRRIFLASLCAVAAGCGGTDAPELVEASGVVSRAGRPFAGVTVMFVPQAEGQAPIAIGITDAEGKFVLKTGRESGVVPGTSKVMLAADSGTDAAPTISSTTAPDPSAIREMGEMMKQRMGSANREEKSLLPKKYTSIETSGLSYEVVKGEENHFEIKVD